MTDKEKEEKVKNCDHHVYAIIEEEYVLNDKYHYPVIECIKCGLTNKNVEADNIRSIYEDFNFRSIETKLFRHYTRFLDKTDYDKVDYISEQLIGTLFPNILYEIAKRINLTLDIDSKDGYPMIAEVMNKLNDIAITNNLSLTKEEDINILINIYNNERDKTYKKTIK